MNKRSCPGVLPAVRAFSGVMTVLATCFLVACSSSRTVGREQALPPGNHVAKTVMDSDFLIPAGAAMVVDYSNEARFFVAKGGALTGFPKGARLTKVFAETGAIIPDAQRQPGVIVRTVDDAAKAFQDRHRELPPVGMDGEVPRSGTAVPVVGVQAGFLGWRGWGWGRGWSRSTIRSGRPVSVRPSSYRISQ